MFCTVKGLEELGTAKRLEIGADESAVEFFDGPGNDGRTTRIIPNSRIVQRTLGVNTRVYHLDPSEASWIVGRVVEDMEGATFVRFANKADRLLPHAELYVRWKKSITDPSVFLAHGITETPQYANARSEFLRSYIAQRAASGGIPALLSSAIELETHQVNVVRRVLKDTSQRHLLADEVGLGKTIEAGVIIRQAVLDDPKSHRIVVIAPESLIHQWRTELATRFGLREQVDDSILICPLTDTNVLGRALQRATMLVIDEAHHLCSVDDPAARQTYELVAHHSRAIDRLLLLSATPVLRNEAGFFRMLHLLDPVVYRLENEASFKAKVLHRQALAEAVAFLDPENVLSLEPVLDDLAQRLPADRQLQQLIATLKARLSAFPESEDPELQDSIRVLRAHLSETYRLHRRILRNRRKNLRFITPERRGSECYLIQGAQADRVESLLEDWRAYAHSHGGSDESSFAELATFYCQMISAFLEGSDKLAGVAQARLQLLRDGRASASFAEEPEVLGNIVNACADDTGLQERLLQLRLLLQKFGARSKKAVVFCSEEAAADRVFAYLADAGVGGVVRHSSDNEEDEHPWLAFQHEATVGVIVCGSRAEEGLNLQGRERILVHFDLPLSPGRIEQRIGRVDRYGSGSDIVSVVLVDQGSRIQRGWYTLLNEGLGVFRRSIASLQYLLEDEAERFRRELFTYGEEFFAILSAEYSGADGKVTRELRLIDEQDALDELTVAADASFDTLEEIDSEWTNIDAAVTRWVVGTLLFDKVPEREGRESRSPAPPYRFRYQRARSNTSATLIPLSGLIDDFLGALDLEAPEGSSDQPLSHAYSAHRKTAVMRKARPLRYGDVFIDAVKKFSDTDDRGRSFGIWRRHAGAPDDSPALYFRFDFLIETQLADAEACLARAGLDKSAAAHAALRRRGDSVFAPLTRRIWLTQDGDRVESGVITALLELPYQKEAGVADYLDINLNASRLRQLKNSLPETFSSWSESCLAMRVRAEACVRDDSELQKRQTSSLNDAARESNLRLAQLTARLQTLTDAEAEAAESDLRREAAIDEALRAGVATPSIRVDVAGFIILSRRAYPEDLPATGASG